MQIINIYKPDPDACARALAIVVREFMSRDAAGAAAALPALEDIEIEGDTYDRAEFRERLEAEETGRERWESEPAEVAA